ncbi:MAG: NrfD/PsrC family molybdoenzyme membrane anchor subunit [Bacteroidales bacterium]|nr:NrfD/PsrC family molybdoenzyme membrane anchor subunit [Bacteroidales bacterium]
MSRKIQNLLKIIWAVLFIIGLTALIVKFATGERLVGYGSYVPWGLWVALYFHFVGIAGGVFVVGAGGYILNLPGFRENIRAIMIISASSVVAGLLAIWLDLGQPFRFQNIFLTPNFGSMMTFNAWSYTAFFIMMAFIFLLSYKKDNVHDLNDRTGWLLPIMILGMFISVAFPSQSGSFFGVVDAKPFWNSGLLSVMFLTSAITSGVAVLLFYYTLVSKSKFPDDPSFNYLLKILTGGLVAYMAAEFAEYSIAYWSPNSHTFDAAKMVIQGPFWWVFWIIHIGGAVVALVLLFTVKTKTSYGIAAFIIAVTFVSARLNVLIPGQSIEQLQGLQDAFRHARLSFVYTATPLEYLVSFFIATLPVGMSFIGIKILNKIDSANR